MFSQCHPSAFIYTPEQIANVRARITADRFHWYLFDAKGDERTAIRQYERNAAVSEAFYGVLQGFEVALRNSMHDTMTREMGAPEWYKQFLLNEPELRSIASAEEK